MEKRIDRGAKEEAYKTRIEREPISVGIRNKESKTQKKKGGAEEGSQEPSDKDQASMRRDSFRQSGGIAPNRLTPRSLAPSLQGQYIRKNSNPKPAYSNNAGQNRTIAKRIPNHRSINLLMYLICEHAAALSKRKNHLLLAPRASLTSQRIYRLTTDNANFCTPIRRIVRS